MDPIDDIIGDAGDVADDASGGLGAAGIGAAAGLISGAASGILGLVGTNNQNSAASALQQQAEAYNTQMADTVWQRTVKDMDAAGINPMLAYSQIGGDASPQAPMYTPQNTLTSMSSSARDVGDIVHNYQTAQKQSADVRSAEAQADVAKPMAAANLSSAQGQAETAQTNSKNSKEQLAQNQVKTRIATASQQATIDQNGADARTAKAKAQSAETDASWAEWDHKQKAFTNGLQSAKDLAEAVGIPYYLKKYGSQMRTINPKTTGTFDLGTGEIFKQ